MEDNLTSADPLSNTTTGSRVGLVYPSYSHFFYRQLDFPSISLEKSPAEGLATELPIKKVYSNPHL